MEEKISESDKIKLKFDAIWKAREIEMASFSARALYIWGFLALCYGAYAYLLYQAVSAFLLWEDSKLVHPVGTFDTFNGLLMVVAMGIFALSALWVCLIKGANAWAERTDWIAECFTHHVLRTGPSEGSCCVRTSTPSFSEVQKNRNCKNCKGNPCHVCLLGMLPCSSDKKYLPKWDKSLFSKNGGTYSPNKVYLFIAQISVVIGFVLAICHAGLFIVPFLSLKDCTHWMCKNSYVIGIIAICLLLVFPGIAITVNHLKNCLLSHLKSTTLEDDMSVFRALQGDEKS